MAETVAWAVEGGRADAASARRVLWNATKGASGITTQTDLKVTALTTPGGAVNVAPGGAVIASTYGTAGKTESYGVNNAATKQVQIPGGRASDANWAVICRINDWNFNNGSEPSDPLDENYWLIDVVFAANLVDLIDPYILLATVYVPANTAAITNAMITDKRNMANPRTEFHQITNALTAGETETLTNTTTAGERFPNAGGLQRLDIPSWATRASIAVRWSSLLLDSAASTGRLWVEWGADAGGGHFANKTQEFSYAGEASTAKHRVGAEVADYVAIPAELRGQSQVAFAAMGRKVTGVGATMDSLTGMVYQIMFEEVPDPSYT